MPQNSFEFENAIRGLRAVEPVSVPTAENLIARRSGPTRYWLYRSLAVGSIALAAAGVFWPRSTSGVAWAQVVAAMSEAQRYHVRTCALGDTEPFSEYWVDGPRYAFVIRDPVTKALAYESRCDGEYSTSVQVHGKPRNGSEPIAIRQRVSGKPAYGWRGNLGSPSNLVDDIIRRMNYRVLAEKEINTPKGKLVRYTVSQTLGTNGVVFWKSGKQTTGSITLYIYADPTSKLMVRSETLDPTGQVASATEVEYPAQIDDDVFKFKGPNLHVLDLDEDRTEVSRLLETGLGSATVNGHKIVLRSVLYDRDGGLWVLWTGGLPRGDLRYPVKVLGLRTPKVTKMSHPNPRSWEPAINAYSLKAFTANASEKDGRSRVLPAIGARIGGMALGVTDKTFSTVDVIVPILDETGAKMLGEATFKKVPVHRIGSIYDYAKELGLR